MNSIRFYNKARYALSILQLRTFSHTKQYCQISVYPSGIRSTKQRLLCISSKPVKHSSFCNFMQTGDSGSPVDEKDNEKMRKIWDDEEFQNILKDFANDFGVENEDSEILEDIRKNIESKSEEKECANLHTSSNSSLKSTDLGLNKFKEFSDFDTSVIYDYHEQYNAFAETEAFYHVDQELKSKSPYLDLKRGITGVFDIDELIEFLRNESLLDITTIANVPYADFLVLATVKSERHSDAVTELLLKLYKRKKNKADPFIKVIGEKTSEWKTIDMGNIVLYILSEEKRAIYDIESLRLFDLEYDSGGVMQSDPMFSILEEQMAFFNAMQQSQSPEKPKDVS